MMLTFYIIFVLLFGD